LIEVLESQNKIRSINFEGNSMAGAKERPPRGKPKEAKSSKVDKKAVVLTSDWKVVCSYMKKSNLLQHIDLSNTFLCQSAVYYIVKRLAKSMILQSVHFSGISEQITQKTENFI